MSVKKMKRAFSTLSCYEAELDEIISLAAVSDIRGIEMRLDKQNNICGLGVEDAAIIRSKFDAAGCIITDLATSVSVAARNDDAVRKAEHCIDLAAALGVVGIRIFVGGHMKTFDDIPNQDLVGAAESVSQMCEYAAKKGVEIWAETHSSLSTAKAMNEFCDTVGARNIRIIWDVLHSVEFGESVEDSVRILGDRLAHVHLKDAIPPADPKLTQYHHTALGEGHLPLVRVLELLTSVDYDGYLSLEFEAPWRPELKDCYPNAEATLAAYNSWLDTAER